MGALADMIRAGVDPDLIERVVLELSGKPQPKTPAERQAKRRAIVKASRENVTENADIRGEGSHACHEQRDAGKKEGPQTPKEKTTPSEPTVPQGDVPSPLDEKPKTILFDAGLRWLCQVAPGKSEQQIRRLVGQMLRDMGGDGHAAQLLGILRDAKEQQKADPISWIQGVVKSRGARAGPHVDGAAVVIRKIHENLDGPRNHPDDPSWQTCSAAARATPRLAPPHERDRDRSERPYLDLVAASGK